MREINFTILGNHKSATGNAVPKLKMTGKQHWTPRAREYVEWKEHVVRALVESLRDQPGLQRLYVANYQRHNKPIVAGPIDNVLMKISSFWSNKTHGDPENIFGSIADALFVNDKNLDCMSFASMSDRKTNGKPQGYVDVRICFFESEAEKNIFIKKYK